MDNILHNITNINIDESYGTIIILNLVGFLFLGKRRLQFPVGDFYLLAVMVILLYLRTR